MQPEQILAIFGNKEVAEAVTRLEGLHAQVDKELKNLQLQLKDSYTGDEREHLQEKVGHLREMSQTILKELRELQRKFPVQK